MQTGLAVNLLLFEPFLVYLDTLSIVTWNDTGKDMKTELWKKCGSREITKGSHC